MKRWGIIVIVIEEENEEIGIKDYKVGKGKWSYPL